MTDNAKIEKLKSITVIRVPLDHGYAEFECRQVGSLDLSERLKRQERLWSTDQVVAQHQENRLFRALTAGNGVLASTVLSRYPDRTALDIGDEALEWIAYLFDIYRDAQALRYDPDHAENLDGYQRLGHATVTGEVAFIKDADTIAVLHITDAHILGGPTWTPTTEENAYLDEATSTAAGRIRLAHSCRHHGDIQGAVEVGVWYNRDDEDDDATLLGLAEVPSTSVPCGTEPGQ